MANEDMDIRVYGGYLAGDGLDRWDIKQAISEGLQVEEFTTSNSAQGYVIQSSSGTQTIVHYIVFGETTHCHLFASVTEDFYTNYRDTLRKMAESIVVM